MSFSEEHLPSQAEVLDLLFDQENGILVDETSLDFGHLEKNSTVNPPNQSHNNSPDQTAMPGLTDLPDLGDLDQFPMSDDFLSFLGVQNTHTEQESFDSEPQGTDVSTHKTGHSPGTGAVEETDMTLNQSKNALHFDHKYSRSPLHSDSGVSLDGTCSPPHSDYSGGMSPHSGHGSPCSTEDSPSPLSGDSSDVNMEDLTFSTLDTAGITGSPQDYARSSSEERDVTLDIGIDINSLISEAELVSSLGATDDDKCAINDLSSGDTLPFTMDDVKISQTGGLMLSDEEKFLLAKEGVVLPQDMPLTKEEERALKGVRRKIRNKVSAKESRKRKQEYMDGLEKRVKACTVQNQQLQKKVNNLEKQNLTLLQQLKKIQNLVSSSNKPAQTGTCIMVLMLSFALLVVPNINPFTSRDQQALEKRMPMGGRSRSLLNEAGEGTSAETSDPYGLSAKNQKDTADPSSKLPVLPDNVQAAMQDIQTSLDKKESNDTDQTQHPKDDLLHSDNLLFQSKAELSNGGFDEQVVKLDQKVEQRETAMEHQSYEEVTRSPDL